MIISYPYSSALSTGYEQWAYPTLLNTFDRLWAITVSYTILKTFDRYEQRVYPTLPILLNPFDRLWAMSISYPTRNPILVNTFDRFWAMSISYSYPAHTPQCFWQVMSYEYILPCPYSSALLTCYEQWVYLTLTHTPVLLWLDVSWKVVFLFCSYSAFSGRPVEFICERTRCQAAPAPSKVTGDECVVWLQQDYQSRLNSGWHLLMKRMIFVY